MSKSKQVSKSFGGFCLKFRVPSSGGKRRASLAEKPPKGGTRNFSTDLVTFAHLLIFLSDFESLINHMECLKYVQQRTSDAFANLRYFFLVNNYRGFIHPFLVIRQTNIDGTYFAITSANREKNHL